MTNSVLSVVRDERGVVTATLARADKHNAINLAMVAALDDLCAMIERDRGVRALIIKAEGPSFCAGGDLAEMATLIADGLPVADALWPLAGVLLRINALPVPTLAIVQGGAFGAGLALCAVVDQIIAHPKARFGATETRLGLLPSYVGVLFAARVGAGWARQWVPQSHIFDAGEARLMGLASMVTEHLDDALTERLGPILSAGPAATRLAKTALLALGQDALRLEVAQSIELLARHWQSQEAQAGLAQFLGGR